MRIQMGLNYKDKPTNLKDILDVNSKVFYDYYRENRKQYTKRINRQRLWTICLNTLFKAMSEIIAEKEGGVMINNLGYFCYVMRPKKTRRGGAIKAKFNYRPYFFGSGHFKWWSFEGNFAYYIKEPQRFGNKKKRELNYTIFNSLKIKL